MRAQAIRANLLARATAISFGGFVRIILAGQVPAGAPRRLAQRTTVVPPMMSSRRKSRCPFSMSFPTLLASGRVLFWRKPDPRRKITALWKGRRRGCQGFHCCGANCTNPWNGGQARGNLVLSSSGPQVLLQGVDPSEIRCAAAVRSSGFWQSLAGPDAFRSIAQAGNVLHPLRDDQAEFHQMPPQRVDRLRSRAAQKRWGTFHSADMGYTFGLCEESKGALAGVQPHRRTSQISLRGFWMARRSRCFAASSASPARPVPQGHQPL